MASEQKAAASWGTQCNRPCLPKPHGQRCRAGPAHSELRWVLGPILLIFNFFNYCYIFTKQGRFN